ncbi:MAG: HAD-IA family hydrolase [Parcubacteria group bacterium]|nr:HAD-IA family hydrolase [Parcubacteria group bacterium]
MVIKTIIFDLGGVFVSDANIYFENHLCDFSSVLDFAGVSKEDAKELWEKHWPKLKYGEENMSEYWKDFQTLIKNGVDINEVIKKYQDKIIIDNGVLKFASNLKNKYRLLALANESKDGIDLKNDKFKLPELFEKIYCSAYLNMAKPNKDIYEYVIEDANIDLSTTIFIDNQIENVKAAESLGIRSILFKNLEQLKKELNAIGVEF